MSRYLPALVGALSAFAIAAGLDATIARAAATNRYAYVGGTDQPSGTCTAQDAEQCSLTAALAQAQSGDTVDLATPTGLSGGSCTQTGCYVGNWTIDKSVLIEPAPGIGSATLDGNNGLASGCTTPAAPSPPACNGAVITISAANVSLTLDDVTIRDADHSLGGFGGGIDTAASGATLTVNGATFANDRADRGGGAIYSVAGATTAVTASTFANNSVSFFGGGGAIDTSDCSSACGFSTLVVNESTFSANSATDGGAIDNADQEGTGTVSIAGSTFNGNSATDGGAIDSGDFGGGIVTVSVTVADSTFASNTASKNGGAIDNADNFGAGTLTVTASTLTGDTASANGAEIAQSGAGEVGLAADVLAGGCFQLVPFQDEGYNVGRDGSCFVGGSHDVDAGPALSGELGPLAYNGGPTQTVALLAANPASGIIPNPSSVSFLPPLSTQPIQLCPSTDQRGVASGPGAACDGGAVQARVLTVAGPSATATYGGPLPALPGPRYSGFVLGQNISSLGSGATCTVAGPVTNAGTYPIVCSGAQNAATDTPSAPDTNYEFVYLPGTLTVNRAPQTITFAAPPRSGIVGAGFVVSATGGGSGNPVVFSIDPQTASDVCSLEADGRTIDFTGPGPCVVDATQAGNIDYLPAAASETLPTVQSDRVYWADFESGAIREESRFGVKSTLYTGERQPSGVAIDIASGKIYWADTGSGSIRVGNLDGSGRPRTLFRGESAPLAVAIARARGKIYWTDYNSHWDNNRRGAIRVGRLSGGAASTLFASQYRPTGLAVDPLDGKIYWSDYLVRRHSTVGAIRVGRLSGSALPATLFRDTGGPAGVAVDPVTGRIYWSDIRSGAIMAGNADGSGGAAVVAVTERAPFGVAIDPVAWQIYWTDYHESRHPISGMIRVGSLASTGAGPLDLLGTLFSGESGPSFLALVRAPAGTGVPIISGVRRVGRILTCERGSWAPDVVDASLYQAPRRVAYTWTLNGASIPGARAARFRPTASGSYACTLTATNPAGSASQTSSAVAVGTGLGDSHFRR